MHILSNVRLTATEAGKLTCLSACPFYPFSGWLLVPIRLANLTLIDAQQGSHAASRLADTMHGVAALAGATSAKVNNQKVIAADCTGTAIVRKAAL